LAHVGGEQEEEQPGDLGGEAGEGVGIAERGEQAVGGVRALDPVPADGEDEAVEFALELGDALAVEAEDGAALGRRQSIEQGDPGGVEARLVLKDRVELVEGERLGLLGELLGELPQLGGAADQIGALGDGGARRGGAAPPDRADSAGRLGRPRRARRTTPSWSRLIVRASTRAS
jgi:hypothetical protein